MTRQKILLVLASLSGASLALACDKTPTDASEVPGEDAQPAAASGEHACGNHADGACGADDSSKPESSPESAPQNTHSFEIPPEKFAEANFTMKADSTVTVTFSGGSDELAWDVHSHDHSGGTKIHDQGSGMGKVVFTAPEDGIFSVLWKNPSTSTATPLEVSVELGPGATMHSWMPE